ncbi:DctP family TRAP transporter solute-binding subunit [Oceanobacillus jeddahense]|uniref:DctP family TRAP transporter solute-binding subunit n=1 Tax=Oceanobacillus jeddahense TaxID=1462527 RepID=A0ABY5JRF2_9BACI|nr:DctP family TRAP transporter solute-binding subunit [Oceanobacillus jeddahense]UUI02871.1 DctP family TRAP transporter solute-binding subunit [Oceanobacillus jeddahense]
MKKYFLVTVILFAITLAACSNSSNSSEGAASGSSTTTLKLNFVGSTSDPTYPLWEEFAKELEERSEGTLEVEIYPSESLGNTTDMIESISKGATVLQDSDPSHLSDYVDDFSIFMHPYLFQEPDDIEAAWKSDVGQRMSAELEEKGIKIVTAVYFGKRHLLSDVEVVTRDDTQGMKIRNAPTTMWNEVSKTLGGNPTNTAWSETYSALSQGVADAAESPLSLLYSSKLYETKDRISLTGHLVATTTIVMSTDVYDSLPPEAQKAIDEVGQELPDKRVADIEEIEVEYRQKLEDEGIKFNEIEPESFIEASENVSDAFPEWTDGLYEDMKKAIE